VVACWIPVVAGGGDSAAAAVIGLGISSSNLNRVVWVSASGYLWPVVTQLPIPKVRYILFCHVDEWISFARVALAARWVLCVGIGHICLNPAPPANGRWLIALPGASGVQFLPAYQENIPYFPIKCKY